MSHRAPHLHCPLLTSGHSALPSPGRLYPLPSQVFTTPIGPPRMLKGPHRALEAVTTVHRSLLCPFPGPVPPQPDRRRRTHQSRRSTLHCHRARIFATAPRPLHQPWPQATALANRKHDSGPSDRPARLPLPAYQTSIRPLRVAPGSSQRTR
ncbi:hypothetical protein NDU88_002373 [Pleurodeles waltl]|uniref:Uncharacterized protein n=1 Tax=Pleurodeles waltl TaxID=8319 RepID=A0AAV7SF23_PLEWA|nr:hypothetical protein NDU88_002373 [Pleurodeles waltl]